MRDHERVADTQREGQPVVELHRYVASHDVHDLGTPGWQCRPEATPSGISARVWTISNPGVGEGKRCNSVRLNVAGAAGWVASDSVI